MKTIFLGLSLLSLAVSVPMSQARAQSESVAPPGMPFLHPIFSDNAVLQRGRRVPVWGWGAPGSSVSLKVDGGAPLAARCGLDGKWTVAIGPYAAGGPHTLEVNSADSSAKRSNILFGDVWLCSGQSNMEWAVADSNNPASEIAAANFPQIRLLTVPRSTPALPKQVVEAAWQVCSPATIPRFSAVGYFFGRKLHQELGVPIGLINSSWGGTIAEAWVSEEGLAKDTPEFGEAIEGLKDSTGASYAQRSAAWFAKNDAPTKAGAQATAFDDSGWKATRVPGDWEKATPELANFDGVVWYRRVVDVPASMAGKDATLRLGNLDDRDTTFWNGEEVGSMDNVALDRAYVLPGAKLKAGRNVLAIRILDTGGAGGFTRGGVKLDGGASGSVDLAGEWKYLQGVSLGAAPSPPANSSGNPNVPTVLYNGMVAPITPYGLKGAIWYQGESNAGRGEQYKKLLPELIRDWRSRFGSGAFPFYIVQLAGFMAPDDQPRDDGWPRLREAQNFAAKTVGNAGVALAIDIGEEGDIHPKNKQDVGLRLALNALAKDYGKKVVFEGPTLASAKRVGSAMVLKFANTGGKLELRGDSERVFAIAGEDKKFVWATPTVKGDTITLAAPGVAAPVAARFGWSNLPRAFVYNAAGLPASPFRTDAW